MEDQKMSSAINPRPVCGSDWEEMHNQYIEEAKSKEPDVVFIGDSLIQYMMISQVWNNYFKPLNAVNFGIGGDKTQHVLWRVINGEMDNMKPKVVVLLVGTNNISNKDVEVVEAILEIAKQIHARQNQAKIILLGIPPKGQYPNKYRVQIDSINKGLSEQAGSVPYCTFLPTDPKLFIDEKGEISQADLFDFLHLSSVGYGKICGPIRQLIQEMLGKSPADEEEFL